MTQQLYTIREAAELLGNTEGTVRKWLFYGKIKGIKEGGWRVKVPASEIIRLKEVKLSREKYQPGQSA